MGEKKAKPTEKLAAVSGSPTVFAPKAVFDAWKDDAFVPDPKGFVGIVRVGKLEIISFHDPESTYAIPTDDGVLLAQLIFSSNDKAVAKHLENIPDKGWKPTKGTYVSSGGEHVLFDALRFYEESGEPVRVELPKGDYTLEELGMWAPDDETEMVLARLVRQVAG